MDGVKVIAKSANAKTGPVAATYAAQSTCPDTCPFMGSGCYAESGPMAIHTRRLNECSDGPIPLAQREAAGIRALPGDRPLRVHVVGDCSSDAAAWLVSTAMESYPAPAWTYTHAWRDVQRMAWHGASVLASCETPSDIREARAQGYATCVVVDQHPGHRMYDLDGLTVLPCPAESTGRQCIDCLLCSQDAMLREKEITIGFAAHGSGAKKCKSAIADRKES